MNNFTKKQLGKWESIYDNLIEGVKIPLKESTSWILGNKHGLIGIFNQEEILYFQSSNNIYKSVNSIIRGGVINDFRTMIAMVEFNISVESAPLKAAKGPLALKIDKKISTYSFSIIQAPKLHINKLSNAFNVVSDSTFGGPTVKSNVALDRLPN